MFGGVIFGGVMFGGVVSGDVMFVGVVFGGVMFVGVVGWQHEQEQEELLEESL